MTDLDRLRADLARIEARRTALRPLREHWNGRAPSAFMSKTSRDALDDRLSRLSVNFPRLLVTAYTDRMDLTGFKRDGKPDAEAWARHVAAGLRSRAHLVHTDRLMYGAAYVTVWPEPTGPVAVLDNPFTLTTDTDPITGTVSRAVRYWNHGGKGHALEVTADTITRWTTDTPDTGAAGQWKRTGEAAVSPWCPDGLVPVVPFIRHVSTDDHAGTSVAADILDLTDAENKIMADAMVTSESYARPRRWATGLEIQVDDDGTPIDPFARGRSLQSEDPETKFGQFDAARLDSYADMSATLTQLIGALTGLPPHYLGLHGDQPASAEGVRAAEAQLTSRVYTELDATGEAWGRVASLIELAAHPAQPTPSTFTAEWASPEIRTPAQAADSAAKLVGIGVPLESVLADPLGWTPEQIRAAVNARRSALVDQAAADLAGQVNLS